MKLLLLFIFLFFFSFLSDAQSIQEEYDKQYALKVKQLDEFIERFNSDTLSESFLKNYTDKYFNSTQDTFSRKYFLKTLFNQENNFRLSDIKEFIALVDSPDCPFFLDFYDPEWYAVLDCNFNFLGRSEKIQIILQNQVKAPRTSKWVITSIKSDLFFYKTSFDSSKIIHPMSHALDFISLDKCLKDKNNALSYYLKNFQPDVLSEFFILIQYNLLTLKKINATTFYFFQIPNWFLKVEYFSRPTHNSGWLISQLEKVSLAEKTKFKKELLNIH